MCLVKPSLHFWNSFDVPSTIDFVAGNIWAVNARFGVANPDTATYSVVKAG